MPNWIRDQNLFSLAGPHAWFLRKLWDFDDSLVILPSRQGFYYRLAQRRKLQLQEKVAYEALKEQADTAMMMSYGLVPVTTITATANWSNPYIFVELHNRSVHRMGGHEKVNADWDAQDRKDDLDKRVQTDEHLTSLGKDAWGLYNKKIGTRTHMWSPKVRDRKTPAESKAPAIILAHG